MVVRARMNAPNVQPLIQNLEDLDRKIERVMIAAVDFAARQSENNMKTRAPWSDQTTNARNGLHTLPFHQLRTHGYFLAHGVPYGIWLEVRWNGKYGIIPQSTREGGMMVMSLLTRLLAGLDPQ